MTTTQALDALNKLTNPHIFLVEMQKEALAQEIRHALTRQTELEAENAENCRLLSMSAEREMGLLAKVGQLEKAAEGMAGVLRGIVHAIDTGNIDSPEIGEHRQKWHEEWLYYASERLAAYRKIKGEVQ